MIIIIQVMIASSPFIYGALSEVMAALEEVKEMQKIHSNILPVLMKNVNGVTEVGEVPPDRTSPLKTTQEMEEVEVELKDNFVKNKFVSTYVHIHVFHISYKITSINELLNMN